MFRASRQSERCVGKLNLTARLAPPVPGMRMHMRACISLANAVTGLNYYYA